MSFVKRSAEPPKDLKEGDILEARITDFEYVEGDKGPQVLFKFVLEGGFTSRDWMAFYEEPSERSRLGELCLTLVKHKKTDYSKVDDALKALKELGRVYVMCKGFRDFRGRKYPKMKVATDKLPPFQETLESTSMQKQLEKSSAAKTVTITQEELARLRELAGKN